MEQKIGIRFSGGGNFEAVLYRKEAPETCEKLWNSLPFEGHIIHGSFTGLGLFFFVEFIVGKVENPIVSGAQPGDLILNTYANKGLFEGKLLHEEIIIPYSKTGIFWNWAGLLPSNLFGKIIGNGNLLYNLGRRIKINGAETINLSKI